MIIKKYRIVNKRLYRRTRSIPYESLCSGCYYLVDKWYRHFYCDYCYATTVSTYYKYLPQPTEKCY